MRMTARAPRPALSGSPGDLDTAELRSFAVLAEAGHFGRAAERLGISQPALTKRVQHLEAKVGGALFERGRRESRLTDAGRVLAGRVPTLLREAELAVEESRRAARGEAGLLRIGFGVASLVRLLPEAVQRFRQARPAVGIHLRDMATAAQVEALREGELDLGFVRLPVGDSALEATPVLHERLLAAVGPGSGWQDRTGLASLTRSPFVVCARSTSASYFDAVMKLCRAAGFDPGIACETHDLYSLLQLVRAGIGVALVPSAAASMRAPGVRFRELRAEEAPAWQIGIARRRSPRSALVEAFVDAAVQVSRERRSG